MRVTDASSVYGSLSGLQSTASRLADLQFKLASGKQINRPSDDPSGTVRALQLRAEAKRTAQYGANASDALGWMSTADSAYGQATKLLQSARTYVVQGLNTGTTDLNASAAIANQIDAIRASLITVANTAYNGRPVFGGTTSGSAAYDSAGTYIGDNGTVSRTVGDQTTVQINQTGPQAFGAPGSDVFTLLANISTQLRTNPAGMGGTLASLDSALNTLSSAQAAEGAAYQQVQNAQAVQTATSTNVTTQLSSIQDIDLAATAVQVSTANVTYQAALQTTASVRQMSLLNFLR